MGNTHVSGLRKALAGVVVAAVIALGGVGVAAAPANAATVAGIAPVPTIGGAAIVGRTLTVKPGSWGAGVKLGYQWFFGNGDKVPSAATKTLVVRPGQVGRVLHVVVTGTWKNGSKVSVRSAATGTVQKATLTASIPTLTSEGVTSLGVFEGSWSPVPRFSYQWYRVCPGLAPAAIVRATASSYTVGKADNGCRIQAQVTGSLDGYNSRSTMSAASLAVREDGTDWYIVYPDYF